jgi:hypothetical protein
MIMAGKLGLGVLAALLLVAGGLGVHTLAAAPHSPRTFTLVVKEREAQVVDLGPAGPSHGDLRLVNAPLYNEQETKVIGREDAVCTLTDPADEPSEQQRGHLTLCVVTYSLPDGEITAQGLNSRSALTELPTSNRHAITGGTGTYQTARGDIPYETRGEKVLLTFHLILTP